uniref:Serine protease inhibitor (SERPIN) family protein n=1 Tax=Tanacetum cinerariifolium TaxID=118510 RepID=A0A699L1H6_TANCI|nr:serine protease inhibitor (SERPIN) family protein [Tanacetum cinerariifolium]
MLRLKKVKEESKVLHYLYFLDSGSGQLKHLAMEEGEKQWVFAEKPINHHQDRLSLGGGRPPKYRRAIFTTLAIEAVAEVNTWIEKQTTGLIKDILPVNAVTRATRLILANTVYFKGSWTLKFDPSMTKDSDFHLFDGNTVKVPFMTSYRNQLVHEYDGFKVLGLPYSQGVDKRRFTMYMFLPNEKDGIPSLIQKIGSQSDFLERHIPREQVRVGRFMIPKFNISFSFETSDMLKELGLVLPFTPGALTEMADEGLHVSSIHHKAFLEVNEEGTEAAAATTMVVNTLGITPGPVDFVADHPFLFTIREDMSGEVLFMGQVANPNVH